MFFFFFSSRRRHTRYWRDWSSDVCSSDLEDDDIYKEFVSPGQLLEAAYEPRRIALDNREKVSGDAVECVGNQQRQEQIGGHLSSDVVEVAARHPPRDRHRDSVVSGESVDLGGRRIILN